jgi:hypothetical protein
MGLLQNIDLCILSVLIGCTIAIQRTTHLVGCNWGIDVKRNAFCQAGCTHICARARTHISTQIIFILMLGATIFLFRLFFLDAQPVVWLLFYTAMNFEVYSRGLPKWSVLVMLAYFLMRECLTSIFHPMHVISIIIIIGFFILKLIFNCFPLQL